MNPAGALVHGRLIRRHKRFLADVELDSGEVITAHCPNTGSMKNCVEKGADVWLSSSSKPNRKYRYTWELTRTRRRDFIGVNPGEANNIVAAGVRRGVVRQLEGYGDTRREVRYGEENSRIDFLFSGHTEQPAAFVEVKSVTLLESPAADGVGYFPDAVSERGAKHLRELAGVVNQGHRGVLLFCVQHSGIREVRPADHIDPGYGELLRQVVAEGVEVIAYRTRIVGKRPQLSGEVPFSAPPQTT